MTISGINWNSVEDDLDIEVWNRLKSNFWVPEKVPVANDIPAWGKLSEVEKEAVRKVFGGLTMLDTLQSEVGAPVMQRDAKTKHEAAVFANITFMEAIHAQSYSSIFSTLCSTDEINRIFRWVETDETLQHKGQISSHFYNQRYDSETFAQATRKAASVLLESFLFYSGFYLPLKLSSMAKLTNTADIIRLIMRDEGVHGFYIGLKFQNLRAELNSEDQEELDGVVMDLAEDLYHNEIEYTRHIYGETGWTGNVISYLNYNYNKAMMNLGYSDSLMPEDISTPEATILSQMAIDANETHDFFSGSGSSYVIGKVEETDDDDWS